MWRNRVNYLQWFLEKKHQCLTVSWTKYLLKIFKLKFIEIMLMCTLFENNRTTIVSSNIVWKLYTVAKKDNDKRGTVDCSRLNGNIVRHSYVTFPLCFTAIDRYPRSNGMPSTFRSLSIISVRMKLMIYLLDNLLALHLSCFLFGGHFH